MSSVWTLNLSWSVLQTSRPGSGNPKQRSVNADFSRSESLRHRAKNWENRGECCQNYALGVNGSPFVWGRWKTVSEDRWKKHQTILAKKKIKVKQEVKTDILKFLTLPFTNS